MNERSPWWYLKFLLVVLVSLGGVILLLILGVRSTTLHPVSLSELSGLSGLTFPANATLIGSVDMTFFRPHIIARVEIARDGLEAFLEESGLTFSNSLDQRDRLFRELDVGAISHPDWWTARVPERFLAVHHEEPLTDEDPTGITRQLMILIDLDNPAVAVLYIRFFEDA